MDCIAFYLYRLKDPTGISGTGQVADGIVFPNGKVALCWRGPLSSVVIHDSIENVKKLHCHGGNTVIVRKYLVKQDSYACDAYLCPSCRKGWPGDPDLDVTNKQPDH